MARAKTPPRSPAPRNSISQSLFSATTCTMLVGVMAMGILQMAFSVRYFSEERCTSLSGVVSAAVAQVRLLDPDDLAFAARDTDKKSEILNRMDIINNSTGALLMLAAPDGTVLYTSGNSAESLTGAAIPAEYRAYMDSRDDFFAVGTLGGVFDSRFYMAGRACTVNGGQFYLLACSSGEALNSFVGDMFSTFVLSAGLMLLVASVLSILFTGRITLPLRNISLAAQRFGSGDFSVRVPVVGDDEVARLAETFNGMAANLASIDNSRGQFMGNIAHELRTPMTSIKGFIDGMLDGTIPPELQQHYLQLVSDEVGRLARLVQNMLDITKLEAGEYKVSAQSYDIWETLTGVVLADEQRIEDGGVEIEGLAPVKTPVYADPDLVHQVVYNIVDNALKFTPSGGYIRFSVRRLPGAVEVSIRNSGAGISADALPFVFERFYKEDKSRGLNARGSGLGLHICKVLITLSGGTIRVASTEGEWCEFVFTLPSEPPKADPDHSAEAPYREVRGK